MKDKQYYVNLLIAFGYSEEDASNTIDEYLLSCKRLGVHFHNTFMSTLNMIKLTTVTQEELKSLADLAYNEELPNKHKFVGYHGSKRKDLRRLYK